MLLVTKNCSYDLKAEAKAKDRVGQAGEWRGLVCALRGSAVSVFLCVVVWGLCCCVVVCRKTSKRRLGGLG